MKKRKQTNSIIFIVVLLALTVSLILFFACAEKVIDETADPDSKGSDHRGMFYNEQWYELNSNIETVLVMGIDSMETPDGSRADSEQADFIALLAIDDLNKTFSVLHINRDTMTTIVQRNDAGEKYGTFKGQLALAHAYGGGEDKLRCRNTVDVVENLLYNIDIDHYFSVTMDAVPIINDSIGGVTVTLNEDLPALGEEFVKGASVTLEGDNALAFVRWRGGEAEESNLDRMERQRQYISALFDKYTTADLENVLDVLNDVNGYVVSESTFDQLKRLMERLQGYEYEETISLKGEARKDGEFVEYHIDEAAAKETVLSLFYKIEE
ncbi:MAG: LCP family protein [Clostridia bacterium]|nr:LCP family protein [Clostridia bacterium]